jgi:hypothetical protein
MMYLRYCPDIIVEDENSHVKPRQYSQYWCPDSKWGHLNVDLFAGPFYEAFFSRNSCTSLVCILSPSNQCLLHD